MNFTFLDKLTNKIFKPSSSETKGCGFWLDAATAINSLMTILLLAACSPVFAQWVAYGPGPNTLGQVENIAGLEVVGAINAVAPHPTDENIVYVGGVNGGIWKTSNAMSASPSWMPLTDFQASLSIGALEFDPTDASNQTLVAGIGQFSSFFDSQLGFINIGGAQTGLLRTTDGGSSWNPINGGGTLTGLDISGVAARGDTIVISANNGIWRGPITGGPWTQISGGAGTGLPAGITYDLASDPNNPARLFTNAGANGIYRSTNTGANWTKVSNAAMDALITVAPFSGNVEIAVGTSNNVYVAIVRVRRLAGLFRSGNGGNTWTALDLPTTSEGGIHPGAQGYLHLSIAAEPADTNIVYIGGDSQPCQVLPCTPPWPTPNSIGAQDYSGRLFRVDASQPSGSQSAHITHSNTASNSSPHADSRDMDVAANGVLIEGNDGGIYRRTNPRTNTGDWFSMNGNIQTTEFHDVAWDANSNMVIGGAQDTGTPEQLLPSNTRWQSVATADGGDVAVDDTGTPGFSTRYSSNQNFFRFRQRVYNAANVLQSQVLPALTVLGGGNPLVPQFTTPIELNTVDPRRLIIGGGPLLGVGGVIIRPGSVYESMDQGNTITEIGRGIVVNAAGRDPIGYGAAGNPDMLYVGSGDQVFVRTAAAPAALTASATYPGRGTGRQVADIAIDPNAPQTAYVIDNANVYQTTNAGATWTNVTGNLLTLAPNTLRSLAYSTSYTYGSVVVGGNNGVFIAFGPAFTTWSQLGSNLPNVPVFDLEYDATDETLLAGTLGRGSWTFNMARPFEYAAKIVCGIQKESNNLRLARGLYATAINIHNPNDSDVNFFKKLALTFPPEEQRAGKVIPISIDVLKPDEALEVDCEDIERKLFPNGFPTGYIKGFVVIHSSAKLDVTAVYTTAKPTRFLFWSSYKVTSIDVEQIRGRKIKEEKPPGCADLVVQNIDLNTLEVDCPGGSESCVTKVTFSIANVGTANAGPFNIRIVFDPDQTVVVNQSVGGLAAGAPPLTFTVSTPPGRSCFFGDNTCTICVTVDSDNDVTECDETNNKLCKTDQG